MSNINDMSDQELWDLTSDDDDRVKADAYFGLGQRFFERKRYSDAVGPATAAKDLYNKVGDGKSEGPASYYSALVLGYLERHEEAVEYFTAAISLYKEHGTEEMVADSLRGRADANVKVSNHVEAIDDYRAASNFYLAANRKTPSGICLLELGDILGAMGSQTEALGIFEEALKIFQSNGDFIGSGRAHDRSAAALIDLGEMEKAIGHLEEALTIFEYTNNEYRFAYAQYRLGWTLVSNGEPERAIDMLKAASASYKKQERFVDAANADNQIAHAYAAMGYSAEALDLYSRTKTIYEAAGNVESSLLADVNSAKLMSPDNLDGQVVIYKRVIQAAQEEEIDYIEQACKTRLAEILCKYDTDEKFEEALDLVNDVPEDYWGENRQEHARLVTAKALALFELNRDSEAESLLLEVVSHGFASGYAKEMGEAHFLLGMIASSKKDKDKSDDYVAKAVALCLASGDVARAKELSEILLPDATGSSTEVLQAEPVSISESEEQI
jgi:tetratricopeptide (TPR) repeat protein